MNASTTANMTLLTALLELAQHSEGRRVELNRLRIAVGRLTKVVVAMLREGDSVTVDGRIYRVIVVSTGGRTAREKALSADGGVLGDLRPDNAPVASLEDTTAFAAHADKVIITFFMSLESQRRELSNAERRVSDLLRVNITEEQHDSQK